MDMRRAVIFVNALSIVMNVLALILTHAQAIPWYDHGNAFEEAKQDAADDPEMTHTMREETNDTMNQLLNKITILTSIGFLTSVLAMVGALHYQRRFIMGQALYAIINIALQIHYRSDAAQHVETYDYTVAEDIFSIVGACINVYVHVSLIREMRSGIMTLDTYATREAYSCCCLASPALADDDEKNMDVEQNEDGDDKGVETTAEAGTV